MITIICFSIGLILVLFLGNGVNIITIIGYLIGLVLGHFLGKEVIEKIKKRKL